MAVEHGENCNCCECEAERRQTLSDEGRKMREATEKAVKSTLKKVRLIKGKRKEEYVPPAVCRIPVPPTEPRRLNNRIFALDTDHYHVAVIEREDGLVRAILKSKKPGVTHSVVHLSDGFGHSCLFQAIPVGEELSVSWRAHEPFTQLNAESITDEKKG